MFLVMTPASWFFKPRSASYAHFINARVFVTLLSSSVLLALDIESGDDRRAIIGESGRTLRDDIIFAETPDSLKHFEEDAGCDSTPSWWNLRQNLLTLPNDTMGEDDINDYRAQISSQFLRNMQEHRTDAKAEDFGKECTYGMITIMYYIAYYAIKHKMGGLAPVRDPVFFIDMYASVLHPSSFQIYNQHGTLWPINISDLTRVQRDYFRYTGYSADPNQFPDETIGAYDFDTDQDFKVYVYDTDEVPELRPLLDGAIYCKYNPWGAEVLIHMFLLQSKVLTEDPNEADFFFVPQYTACIMNSAPKDKFNKEESDELFKKIIKRLPYFEKTHGRDHVFVFAHENGVHGPFPSWKQYIKDSIFLMLEPELSNDYPTQTVTSYSYIKDILVPGRLTFDMINIISSINLDISRREYLGDFVGWNRPLHPSDDDSKSPRQVLLSLAEDPRLYIRQDVPFGDALLGSSSSSFCFIPRGVSSWTSRLFRVLFANCIPVILNDRVEIPFSELLPVHEWTIKVPMKNIDGDALLNALEEIRNNENVFYPMLLAMVRDRCWYLFPPSKIDYDYEELVLKPEDICPTWKEENAFLAIMKLLARKKRVSKHTDSTFYYPRENGTTEYVDKDYNVLL